MLRTAADFSKRQALHGLYMNGLTNSSLRLATEQKMKITVALPLAVTLM